MPVSTAIEMSACLGVSHKDGGMAKDDRRMNGIERVMWIRQAMNRHK
jgi:hypothetical protein